MTKNTVIFLSLKMEMIIENKIGISYNQIVL